MYRYTTPSITCTLRGLDFSYVALVRIAIRGGRNLIVREISIEEINANAGAIVVNLTQEETASLGNDSAQVEIQGRVKYTDGSVQATNTARAPLSDVLDKVVI